MTEVRGPVTMNDVARVAGVSNATVSRVVNGHYGVSAKTVEKVRAAIEKLGYESSLVATSLRRSQTKVLGFVTHSFESYTVEVLKGVMEALSGTGLDLIVYANSDTYGARPAGWEQRHVTRLAGTLTDGCIIVTPWSDVKTNVPVVAIDPVRDSMLPSVSADNLAGAVTAVNHLLELGHTRIGFIAGRSTLAAAWAREEGYRQALTQAGIPIDPSLIGRGDFHRATAAAPAQALLGSENRPTAIFAASDGMALKVIEVAREFGLDVPGDLSVIGFDNVPESAMSKPPLTTIDQNMRRLGFEAARLLQGLVYGNADTPRPVLVPTQLIIRESTAPPRK